MPSRLKRFRGLLKGLQTLWSIVGLTMLAIAATEAGLRLAFAVKDRMATMGTVDPRVVSEGYGGSSWPAQHFRELELLRDRWQPYVYFRQRPFPGETIHIDDDGLRRTWQPPTPGEAKTFRILMLGGSSLWGYGARDDYTIPSLLARRLHEMGEGVELRDLAEIGYVSTQEVVALMRELQSGDRPDLVIFYDGVNDTTSALLEGEAGLTTNERNRRAEFNILQSPARLGAAMIGKIVRDSASYRLAATIGRRLGGGSSSALPSPDRRDALVSDVVRRYRANLDIVDRLGRGFGFEALYYWQPTVFEKQSPTPYERDEAAKLAWGADFLRSTYDAVRTSPELAERPGFHDLSRLFADSEKLVFIDYCHTTESANGRIADVIAGDVRRIREAARHGGRPRTGAVR